MFADIAPRYDLLNHLLSFNIDRGWRKSLLKSLAPVLARSDATILDLCCGTGDVMLDVQRASEAQVMGADICHPMLVIAQSKSAQRGYAARLFDADALALPIPDNSLDAISIAFGFRNLSDYSGGLLELQRVLKPGGILAILEFSHPPGFLVKAAYGFYSRAILPIVGGIVSGSVDAYSYLPESIRKFPRAEELRRMMDKAGFEDTRFELLSSGIAALHTGMKLTASRSRSAVVA
ncbi:MAG: bifunctional demethylmenaquinone methyltransferase/2-methoxy-6-polyprenyl-1,4-benzoquinol methylase UbiE [Acidobacteriota bacterium]|nr:bifunctional demethylmenaquinone methyltransferase/2-methoxy-6-polyprenyl-1,4-benzoquinol methylase UbiE [Acidobacteriota bacterium]